MVQNMVILVNGSRALGKNVASAVVGLWKGRLGRGGYCGLFSSSEPLLIYFLFYRLLREER